MNGSGPAAIARYLMVTTLALLLGCGGGERPNRDTARQPGVGVRAPADDASESDQATHSESDGGPPEATLTRPTSSAWDPLAVPTPPPADTHTVLLVNRHPFEVIVLADGGSGTVLVDTVPARDSAAVKLWIAADTVVLFGRTLDLASGPRTTVPLRPDSTTRWEIEF